MKTEEIVRSLRWCGTGTEEGCSDCAFEPQCDEDAVGCVGGLCDTAADRLEELTAKKYWPFPTYSATPRRSRCCGKRMRICGTPYCGGMHR